MTLEEIAHRIFRRIHNLDANMEKPQQRREMTMTGEQLNQLARRIFLARYQYLAPHATERAERRDATRLAEIEEEKARREARIAERKERGAPELFAMEVTLDTVEAPELQKVSLDKPPKQSYAESEESEDPSAPDEKEPFVDPVRDETLLIMRDYIRLLGPEPVTAKVGTAETAAP